MIDSKKQSEICTAPLEAHFTQLLMILTQMGLKLSDTCEGTYQAFVEIAELMRDLNGFAPYTPVLATQEAKNYRDQSVELEMRMAAGMDKKSAARAMMTDRGFPQNIIDLLFPVTSEPQQIKDGSAVNTQPQSFAFRGRTDGRFDD